jgi:hypothetical protein
MISSTKIINSKNVQIYIDGTLKTLFLVLASLITLKSIYLQHLITFYSQQILISSIGNKLLHFHTNKLKVNIFFCILHICSFYWLLVNNRVHGKVYSIQHYVISLSVIYIYIFEGPLWS